ncbi:unnamed protein product [Cercopithifilaria johnstoni]|uniref:Uncharacterized protein n=1 Tax=Cercopithifilaria johnstoni TaxID=2874296 RepID=A0A8J2M526_9BILA|nr:unnamed protein product [Cercopithifilaria johnstoni]
MKLKQQFIDGNFTFPTATVKLPSLELGIFRVETSSKGVTPSKIRLIRMSLDVLSSGKSGKNSDKKAESNMISNPSSVTNTTSILNNDRHSVSPKRLVVAERILDWESVANNLHYDQHRRVETDDEEEAVRWKLVAYHPHFLAQTSVRVELI